MTQSAPAVNLNGVAKRYGRRWPWSKRQPVQALAGVDLTVPIGSVMGILGLNGAGKTSLLKVVATLVSPDTGSGSVLGNSLDNDGSAVRRSVGFVVADERSFYWRLSGRHNAAFFGALQGLSSRRIQERVDELAADLGLKAETLDRPVRTYSSGMRKKLALIRAMLHQPRVLLFDEATRGLDPSASRRLRRLVREGLVERHGVSALWATHDLAELVEVCDQVSLMHEGTILARGTPDGIATQVEDHFTAHAESDEEV